MDQSNPVSYELLNRIYCGSIACIGNSQRRKMTWNPLEFLFLSKQEVYFSGQVPKDALIKFLTIMTFCLTLATSKKSGIIFFLNSNFWYEKDAMSHQVNTGHSERTSRNYNRRPATEAEPSQLLVIQLELTTDVQMTTANVTWWILTIQYSHPGAVWSIRIASIRYLIWNFLLLLAVFPRSFFLLILAFSMALF